MRFFGVVNDVMLNSTDPSMNNSPPEVTNSFIAEVISGTTAYGAISVEPMLALSNDPLDMADGPQPAKTVPPHFSTVSLASDRDVHTVFGQEDQSHFWIGSPLDMETKLCLDIPELVMRSNGVFG